MVKNITLEEALNIQEQLSQTEGVAVVSFNADTDYKNSSACSRFLYPIMIPLPRQTPP